MQTTTIGFIGAGDISLLHAEAIKHCDSARLAGIWSIDDSLNAEKSEAFNCSVYGSAEALVADPNVDAVFILTNLETHTQYATLAMNAGKHVLIEKPVAPSIEELEALKACAERNNVILCPGHNYIHEPSVQRTKELLDSGKLGKLVTIYIHYHIHHPESVAKRYPGVIRHILTHHSYILLYLAGEAHAPESVSAMKSVVHYEAFEGEDLALINLRLKSGALAHFCADFAADDNSGEPWTFSVKVIGTEGATRFSYRDWIENKPGVVHAHTFSAYEWHIREEVRHFVEACIQKGAQPLSTIDDAITSQRIIEGCEASVAQKREIDLT
jgi:predicted dehydrogenase